MSIMESIILYEDKAWPVKVLEVLEFYNWTICDGANKLLSRTHG